MPSNRVSKIWIAVSNSAMLWPRPPQAVRPESFVGAHDGRTGVAEGGFLLGGVADAADFHVGAREFGERENLIVFFGHTHASAAEVVENDGYSWMPACELTDLWSVVGK